MCDVRVQMCLIFFSAGLVGERRGAVRDGAGVLGAVQPVALVRAGAHLRHAERERDGRGHRRRHTEEHQRTHHQGMYRYRVGQNGVRTVKLPAFLTTTPPIPTIPGTSYLFG